MIKFFSNLGSKLLPQQQHQPKLATVCHLLQPQVVLAEQVRTVIKYSMLKGKRKTVHAVPKRFYRLDWGIWIRTIAGRHRKMWARSPSNRRRTREHVFCNATQSRLLDKMVSQFWRRPKYYVNDPYAPYHIREEFPITRRKPWRPEGYED